MPANQNASIVTDTRQLEKLYRYITDKQWKQVERRVLNKIAGKIKNRTRKAFKIALPAATHRNPQYSDRLIDAIRKSRVKESSTGILKTAVHAMGTTKSGSGTFRARFFETGTKERHHKKTGKSIGSITAKPFMSAATTMTSDDYADAKTYLDMEIQKLNKKILG